MNEIFCPWRRHVIFSCLEDLKLRKKHSTCTNLYLSSATMPAACKQKLLSDYYLHWTFKNMLHWNGPLLTISYTEKNTTTKQQQNCEDFLVSELISLFISILSFLISIVLILYSILLFPCIQGFLVLQILCTFSFFSCLTWAAPEHPYYPTIQ